MKKLEQDEREWSGGSKRAGADPGSQIRLEPLQEPGSVPAKPLGSLGSPIGPRVAAGDSRPPNAAVVL
jgi:hypothetical protein